MKLGPPLHRAQFPALAEPKTKALDSYIDAHIMKTAKDMNWSPAAGQEQELLQAKINAELRRKAGEAAVALTDPNSGGYQYGYSYQNGKYQYSYLHR
jgi:hypothetical protein